jgi:subtilisin family serine protease
LLIAAAGNDGDEGEDYPGGNVDYPARYSSVIAVAATDINDGRPAWSSYGPEVELAAPGVGVKSTWLDDGYATLDGTSMATPHVTGTAALILAKNPTLTNEDVRNILKTTAEDLGAEGFDIYYGYGLVDAEEATLSS